MILLYGIACTSPKKMENAAVIPSFDSSTQYVYVQFNDDVKFYNTDDTSLNYIIVPAGQKIVIERSGKDEFFRGANFGGQPGYIVRNDWQNTYPYKSTYFIKPLPKAEYAKQAKDFEDKKVLLTANAQNRRDSIINYSNYNGSVQVKGYYRKNGTYVQPHTRSAPKRH